MLANLPLLSYVLAAALLIPSSAACHNQLNKNMAVKTSIIQSLSEVEKSRFQMKVSSIPTPQGCLEWLGGKDEKGYGQFRFGGNQRRAHRVAYLLYYGADPGPLFIIHTCDNPSCCNPEHLVLGTHSDNMKDRAAKGRANHASGESHGSKTKPERTEKGEDRWNAKLTADKVKAIRELYAYGNPVHQDIANQFGISRRSVGLIIEGKTWKHVPMDTDIAERLKNRKTTTVRNVAYGVRNGKHTKPSSTPKGTFHRNARITDQDVREIRSIYERGSITQTALAAQFGITQTAISIIVLRKGWTHVT